MKILGINFSDLVGHVFNGYDLHLDLLGKGIEASQIVLDKRSSSDSVKSLSKDLILHSQIREFEKQYSISNLMFPYGEEIINSFEFQTADLVHYHILHNGVVSLLDYPRLMDSRKSVWTIHDPWIITGNCVHPLTCERWKKGCGNCRRTNEIYFEMRSDNTNFMWELKKRIFSQINPHVVVASKFMEKYLNESPITQHFSNIHIIPFGIKAKKYSDDSKNRYMYLKENSANKMVVGFRADNAEIKGSKFIYEALQKLDSGDRIELRCVGNGHVPENIKSRYQTAELGWVDDESEIIHFFQSCDIFLMPSLAESFGVMAIEAMAAGCTVISFKDTVLEEVTNAPECGIAVECLSSDAIAAELAFLLDHPEEILCRGEQSRDFVNANFSFDTYVDRHIKLYQEILEEP